MKITPNYQLNLNSINNRQNQKTQKSNPQFKARFTAEQIREMAKPYQFGKFINLADYCPRLFVLLGHLAYVFGGDANLAKWDAETGKITIDGKELKPSKSRTTENDGFDEFDKLLKLHGFEEYDAYNNNNKRDAVAVLEDLLVEKEDNGSYWSDEPMELEYDRIPKTVYDELRYKWRFERTHNIIDNFAYKEAPSQGTSNTNSYCSTCG